MDKIDFYIDLLNITYLSLKVGVAATLIIFPAAIFFAYILSKKNILFSNIIESIILLPMILPPSASGLILLSLLSPNNFIGSYLQEKWNINLLLDWKAAVIAAAFVSFPILFKSAQQAFSTIPIQVKEIASAFGANSFQIFISVSLPIALPGIIQGCLLALARSLGEFGATVLVAGIIPNKTETLALAIYSRIISGQDEQAWVFAGVSAILAFSFIFLSKCLCQRKYMHDKNLI